LDRATAETLIGNGLTRSPLPVMVLDATLRVSWVNDAAERVSGAMPGDKPYRR
jgi:hypothetical protein